jgi:hypothetical protein
MPKSKRSRQPQDLPPPQKRARTQSSVQAPDFLPTPNDTHSVTDSRSSADVLSGPANPGVVRDRSKGVLSRLPPDSDVIDIFARLKSDGNLSDEEALLKFITTYDVSLSLLNEISSNVYPAPFVANSFTCLGHILLTSSTTHRSKAALIV